MKKMKFIQNFRCRLKVNFNKITEFSPISRSKKKKTKKRRIFYNFNYYYSRNSGETIISSNEYSRIEIEIELSKIEEFNVIDQRQSSKTDTNWKDTTCKASLSQQQYSN